MLVTVPYRNLHPGEITYLEALFLAIWVMLVYTLVR